MSIRKLLEDKLAFDEQRALMAYDGGIHFDLNSKKACGVIEGARWQHSKLQPVLTALLDCVEALDDLRGEVVIPEKSCSCHLNPPCSDCTKHGALREFIESSSYALANLRKTGEVKDEQK